MVLVIGAALSLGLISVRATITVACVGDSITAGYALTNAGTQSYPAQLQTLLGSSYSVQNYGNSGTTVEKVSDYTYWYSWAYNSATNSSPNIVVMMFGANDSKSWNWNAANFNGDYRALITLFQNLPTHPKVFICYTPPIYLPNAFGTTFDPVFVENTVEPAIAAIATQAGVQLIDNDTPLIDNPDLFTDGVHPNVTGAGIVAQQVYNAINGLAPTNITTAAITSSGTPSVYGSPVTYTATLTSSAGTVTGAVVFAANNVPFSTNTLSGGTASVTNSLMPIGANVVAAQYVSQGKFLGNTHSLYQNITATNALTLTDIGTTAPSPGANDIFQLSTSGDTTWPDAINYFTDNNPPVGQMFTTGTNVMRLTSLAIKTAGLNSGNGYGTPTNTPTYYLSLYSVSNTTATLLLTVSAANPGFTDGDWLKWSGINVPLQANRTYAFTFGIAPSGGGYAALAVATNAYAGGEIVTVPINGGTIATGGSHTFDAVFDLGLQPAPANIPASMPLPMPTYGWNLGNTLEATWGVPNYTAAPFFTAANAGFNAVRIPVAWDFNSTTNISGGITNYVIKPAFMAKVKQTVDNAIAAGFYVVMNDHWDDGWLENNIGTNVDPTINAKMKSYWTQIATTFADYDNHLLFAGANEPNVNNPAEETTLMYYYQTFVNAVRGAGGNNTNRWLVLQSVSDPTWLNALPTDTVSNRIMMEYHQYTPSLFCFIHDDQVWGNAIYFWGPAYHYSGDASRNATWGEEYAIDSFFQQLKDLYVSKGIPVMIGEYGAWSAPLTNATEAAWNSASAEYWNKYVSESARGHGLSPFYWSTASSLFDWTSGAVLDPQRISVLIGGAAPPPPNGAPYAASDLTATGGVGQVTLSWTAGSGATSYNLYRSTASGIENSNAAPVITGITGTSYTNTGLNSGTTYYYQVVAVNGSGSSGFSPEAHATTSGSTDTAPYNFESSSQGWTGGGGIISGIATSTVQHYAGNQSLAVNLSSTTNEVGSPTVGNVAIAAGSTINFHVWIPSGAKISAIQPFVQDHNWNWVGNYIASGSLTFGAWNTITVTVPVGAATPMQKLGVQFFTSAAWTGTCYIDSISFDVSGPDFDLTANPTSLTVDGGTNGTSTLTVTPTDGLNACYTLSVSNLPAGVSATFTNNPSTGGASLLTLTASNNVISGTTNVTVIATAGLISHTQTIALTVNGIAQPNTAPTPAPITDRTVNVGQTVAFTASATDTDQPPQTLTFTLLDGATNATLDANSGAFSFRPLVTQANSTNDFTLQVSDNGTPGLSATQSFFVVVNPLSAPAVSNVSVAGGQLSLSVGGQSGPDYAIETSTNLTQWSTVFVTNSPAVPFVWTDTNSAGPQRFYRIKLGPPLP